jgi:endogenous inhibitor of DNA gyrase (YacG/DUF329 family)
MKCPICQRPVVAEYRPFCSRRCADIDLGNWLNESYAIPSLPPADAPQDAENDHPDTDRLH